MRIINWNVGNQPTEKVHAEIADLMQHAALGVFNEMADQSLPVLKGFQGIQNRAEPGLNRNPIMWREERLELLSQHYKLLVPSAFVGPDGAGGPVMSNKYGHVYKFRDKYTDAIWDIFPVHAIPSVYLPNRKKLQIQHMTGLAPMVAWRAKVRRHKVIVLGDFNEDFRHKTIAGTLIPGKSNHDLLGPLGTHDARAIDAQIGSNVIAKSHKLLGTHGSDHNAIWVDWK